LPDTFLEVAAETGALLPIGRWALRQACRQAASWQQRGPLSLHVNLHAIEVADHMLESSVRDVLTDEVQSILREEVPAFPIAHTLVAFAHHRRVRGLELDLSGRLFTLERVHLDPSLPQPAGRPPL